MKRSLRIGICSFIGAFLVILALAYVIFYYNSSHIYSQNQPLLKQSYVLIDGNSINVEIEDTDAGREQGLSGRKSLGETNGMLFVFDKPGKYGFWMKDMEFPLDMIWIDQNDSIVDITADISTSTYPEVFYPQKNAEYVLEVNSGYATVHNIKIGDKIIIKKSS